MPRLAPDASSAASDRTRAHNVPCGEGGLVAAIEYTDLVDGQREYFLSGATRGVEWRRGQLEALKTLLEENHERFLAVLRQDLHRNDVDSDLMDVGFCIKEADYALKH